MPNILLLEVLRTDILMWVIAVVVIVVAAVTLWLQRREHLKLKWELSLLERLNKRNIELELVLKTMKLATWKVDVPTNTVTLVSDYREQTNYSPSPDTDTKDIFLHLLPKDAKRAKTGLAQLMSGEIEEFKLEYQIKEPQSDTIYWGETYATIGKRDEQGAPLEIIGTSRRIDDQKRIEQELIQAVNKAKESDRLKSAFLANISHEIRTPLNAIVGFSDVLPMVDDDEERTHLVALIQENNQKLLRMINDIVNISKMEAGSEPPVMEDFDLNMLLEEVAGRHRNLNTNQKISIVVNSPVASQRLFCDRKRVSEILEQYMLNALKFTESGTVTLGYTRQSGDLLRIWVSDTGKGIPAGQCEKIFEHFVKLDEFIPGTGLGLPICRSLAHSIGASVGVDSELGKGSVFWVELKVAD